MIFHKKNKAFDDNKASKNTAAFEEKINTTFQDKIVKIDKNDVDVLLSKEEEIAKKMNRSKSLSKYVAVGKVMFGMVRDIQRGAYKDVPWFTIATIVMALLYVLNPMDLIPDFIPGLGYIDYHL